MNPSHSCDCIDLKVTPPTGVALRVSPYIPRLKPLGFTGFYHKKAPISAIACEIPGRQQQKLRHLLTVDRQSHWPVPVTDTSIIQ